MGKTWASEEHWQKRKTNSFLQRIFLQKQSFDCDKILKRKIRGKECLAITNCGRSLLTGKC
jgi:hypothetical protein